jgi:CMP-N-acetylneuraminic acid synthetase
MDSSIVSVKKIDSEHPFRMKRMVQEDILINYIDQGFEDMRPRQDLPPVYIRNGSIYLSPALPIRNKDTLVTNKAYGYIMDNLHSINIDSIEDFLVANYYMNLEPGVDSS